LQIDNQKGFNYEKSFFHIDGLMPINETASYIPLDRTFVCCSICPNQKPLVLSSKSRLLLLKKEMVEDKYPCSI
jgi:hypothetical protein